MLIQQEAAQTATSPSANRSGMHTVAPGSLKHTHNTLRHNDAAEDCLWKGTDAWTKVALVPPYGETIQWQVLGHLRTDTWGCRILTVSSVLSGSAAN